MFGRMPIRTRRWNDPREPDDGFRLLVCRLRPRGLARAGETWDEWWPDLGPSRALLGAFQGKAGHPLPWSAYVPRYLAEMEGPAQVWRLRELGRRVADGETVTLLCSAACTDPTRCHRTVLATLIERSFRLPRPRP
jgi:uncharacterized protein YeaO (DUF488 family)